MVDELACSCFVDQWDSAMLEMAFTARRNAGEFAQQKTHAYRCGAVRGNDGLCRRRNGELTKTAANIWVGCS